MGYCIRSSVSIEGGRAFSPVPWPITPTFPSTPHLLLPSLYFPSQLLLVGHGTCRQPMGEGEGPQIQVTAVLNWVKAGSKPV